MMTEIEFATKQLQPGESLFEEGQAGEEAYRITKGFVSIWKQEAGQRVNLATKGEGDIVGEMALLDDQPRSATVTAEDEVVVDVITKEGLESMLSQAPEMLTAILHQLMESLRCSNDLISAYASRPTES